MLEAVFISDLHLDSEQPKIMARFNAFIDWALVNTRAVYVLGDLFHVWAGDDCAPAWSLEVATQFQRLVTAGIFVYFMPGNRDFLVGNDYALQAGFQILPDPTVIHLGGKPIVLAHGDAYCLLDKAHQRFRRLTRNPLFTKLFLLIPPKWRRHMVMQVRNQSQSQRSKKKSPLIWEIAQEALIKDMRLYGSTTLIHGHIHKPGLNQHQDHGQIYHQFVLSDWDDSPQILVYNKTTGFKFIHKIIV